MMTDPGAHQLAEVRAQLEHLQREYGRAVEMTMELIAAYGEDFRRERRLRQKETDTGVTHAVLLHKGSALLPLGVADQNVVVDFVDGCHEVAATALCSDASEVVVLRVAIKRAQLEHIRAVGGERVEGPDSDAFMIRLIAGEPKVLIEALPTAERIEFDVRRIGGAQCVLRLRNQATEGSGSEVSSPPASSKGSLWKAHELLREGRIERAVQVASAHATDIEQPALNLLRATLASDRDAEWLAHINQYLDRFGLARLRLASGSEPKFFRLDAAPPPPVEGPLVSVLMPAFNAERTLAVAAGSVLKQSWASIELLIVDDCSSDSTWQVAEGIARSDARVKVFRNPVNVGPYVSKNIALSLAGGAYVTCHDADDWAHPQRIERQVEAMRNAGAPACVAGWLRMNESGHIRFTRMGKQSHDGALQLAHVTCMIEAEFMRRHIGYWDSVRFAADGEMLERLERLLGARLLRLQQLSVFSLDVPTSLTNDPAHGISKTGGGLSPARRAYRDSWRQWHAALTLANAYVDFPQLSRPFPAPAELDACVVPVEHVTRVLGQQ